MKREPRECSDGELAAMTLSGREDAFAELMRRHREPIYRVVRGHTGAIDEALDLVQESFIAAYGALETYDGQRSFRAWMSRIAINKCRDWARRRAVRRFFFLAESAHAATAVADPQPGADTAAADRQELDRLWAAIASLPRNLKEPLLLCGVEGLSQSEAAAALGISEKAVETRIYRARRRLAELRDSGDAVGD